MNDEQNPDQIDQMDASELRAELRRVVKQLAAVNKLHALDSTAINGLMTDCCREQQEKLAARAERDRLAATLAEIEREGTAEGNAALELRQKVIAAEAQRDVWRKWCEAAQTELAAMRPVVALADAVMQKLAKHGPSIVPHLMDDDENIGEELRQAITAAKKSEAKHG